MISLVGKPADIFDRDREWRALTGFVTSGQPHATLGVVSGRRRQGKTFLLEALCEVTGGFYFAADQATEAESLRYLAAAVVEFTGSPLPVRFDDWRQAIDTLLAVTADRELPVVIDEFPYLAKASPSLPSVIQAALAPRRAERLRSRARLLLCGSAMSFMGSLLSGGAPLRGRAGLELIVPTLDYRLAAEFWGIDDPRLAIQVHAIVGGTPAYRREFVEDDTPNGLGDFDNWAVRTVLNPASPLFREARYLLSEEPGLRDPGLYHSVLAAVAHGNSTSGGIASYVGRKASDITHPLAVLEVLWSAAPRTRHVPRKPHDLPHQRTTRHLLPSDPATRLGRVGARTRHRPPVAATPTSVRKQCAGTAFRGSLPELGRRLCHR
ncbi:AAA family ATPase [Nocardia sp. R6R-6]|uniref:AAA family ATPase n=1 Tax=Nocardia sp. R6R-6 TaxID=3459303 RepID=UPI00403DB53A